MKCSFYVSRGDQTGLGHIALAACSLSVRQSGTYVTLCSVNIHTGTACDLCQLIDHQSRPVSGDGQIAVCRSRMCCKMHDTADILTGNSLKVNHCHCGIVRSLGILSQYHFSGAVKLPAVDTHQALGGSDPHHGRLHTF